MSVRIHVCPKDDPMSWEDFVKKTPPFSVALDGYVMDGPRFDPVGPHANYNHHENVDRLATRATCAQVLMAIRLGFFRTFRGKEIHLWVNDCDEDVCLSVFLLKYGFMAKHPINPLLNRLVNVEEILDTTAGAYPYPDDLPVLQEIAWIFSPYRRFRLSGELDWRDEKSFKGVIDDVDHRIMKYLTGQGEKQDLDTRYERLANGPNFVMVKEIGAEARTGIFADNEHSYISVRERPDGRHTYTVGRMSLYIPFPVKAILEECSKAEPDPTALWGGSNTIGGSHRAMGSGLDLQQVLDISTQEVVRLVGISGNHETMR